MRENSFARELTRFCFWERARSRFVPFSSSETKDWGVMSGEKSEVPGSAHLTRTEFCGSYSLYVVQRR